MTTPSHAHPTSGLAVAAIAGIALALPFVAIFMYHPDGAYDLLSLILAMTGGVYAGAALRADAPRRALVVEWFVAAVLVILAALSLWWTPLWMAAGFVLHGVWDLVHHARRRGLGVRRGFHPFCAAFDGAVAALVIYFTLG